MVSKSEILRESSLQMVWPLIGSLSGILGLVDVLQRGFSK